MNQQENIAKFKSECDGWELKFKKISHDLDEVKRSWQTLIDTYGRGNVIDEVGHDFFLFIDQRPHHNDQSDTAPSELKSVGNTTPTNEVSRAPAQQSKGVAGREDIVGFLAEHYDGRSRFTSSEVAEELRTKGYVVSTDYVARTLKKLAGVKKEGVNTQVRGRPHIVYKISDRAALQP